MTIVMSDQEQQDELVELVQSIHDGLELPEGYRAEIIGGQITVAASPFGRHAFILQEIRDAVHHALPPGYRLYENVTVAEPDGDRYIPDLALMPDAMIRAKGLWLFPAGACLFAVEATSPKQEDRDYAKADGYARARMPVYLIVDQRKRMCVVHSDPDHGTYRDVIHVPFGDAVLLPLADPIRIETSTF
jgi:Uma2 family endonuclease